MYAVVNLRHETVLHFLKTDLNSLCFKALVTSLDVVLAFSLLRTPLLCFLFMFILYFSFRRSVSSQLWLPLLSLLGVTLITSSSTFEVSVRVHFCQTSHTLYRARREYFRLCAIKRSATLKIVHR